MTPLCILLAAGGFSASAQPSFPAETTGVREGEEAPDFTLRTLRGEEVRLSDFRKKKPVVLVTGSYSCPVYRHFYPRLEQLHRRYGSRAAFFVLYTVEAHPQGVPSPYTGREWLTMQNRREGVLVSQPVSAQERAELAAACQRALRGSVPVLVDGMDNAVWKRYGRLPNGAFIIGSDGEVRCRQDWFNPAELETELLKAFQEEPPRW